MWLLEPVHLMFWVPLGPVGPELPRGTWGYTFFSSYSRWAMPAGVLWGFRACLAGLPQFQSQLPNCPWAVPVGPRGGLKGPRIGFGLGCVCAPPTGPDPNQEKLRILYILGAWAGQSTAGWPYCREAHTYRWGLPCAPPKYPLHAPEGGATNCIRPSSATRSMYMHMHAS